LNVRVFTQPGPRADFDPTLQLETKLINPEVDHGSPRHRPWPAKSRASRLHRHGKRHIRKFLEEALEELGFSVCECTQVGELSAVLDGQAPNLVIAGLPTITP